MKIVVGTDVVYGRLVLAMTENSKKQAPPVDSMPQGKLSSHTARGFFMEALYATEVFRKAP